MAGNQDCEEDKVTLYCFEQTDDDGNQEIIVVDAANYNIADAYMKLTFGFRYPYLLRSESGQSRHLVVGRIPSKKSVMQEVVNELRHNGVNI